MTCNHFGQSSTVFGHGLHTRALPLRHSPLKRTLASAYPPKPLLFELFWARAWRDLESLQAKFHRIWAWFAAPGPTREAQSPQADFSIRVSSQTPHFFKVDGCAPARRGLGRARSRVVWRCGHTFRTILWVDRLIPSTLCFSGKLTPTTGALGWPTGKDASLARGRHVKACSAQKSGPKSCPNHIKGCSFWGRGSENHTFWPLFALKT